MPAMEMMSGPYAPFLRQPPGVIHMSDVTAVGSAVSISFARSASNGG